MLMRKEIAYLREELRKESFRILTLEKQATRSMTGLTITHERTCDVDPEENFPYGGFYITVRRKRFPRKPTLKEAIDSIGTVDSLA